MAGHNWTEPVLQIAYPVMRDGRLQYPPLREGCSHSTVACDLCHGRLIIDPEKCECTTEKPLMHAEQFWHTKSWKMCYGCSYQKFNSLRGAEGDIREPSVSLLLPNGNGGLDCCYNHRCRVAVVNNQPMPAPPMPKPPPPPPAGKSKSRPPRRAADEGAPPDNQLYRMVQDMSRLVANLEERLRALEEQINS